jgi:hypothetical protein
VTLAYRLERHDGFEKLVQLHLSTSAEGGGRLDRVLPIPKECGSLGCVVFGGSGSLLEVRDLDGRAPTALVWLWTGGAHCCSLVEAVPVAGGRVAQHDFGNHGASVARIGSVGLFSSVDDRFSYLYTSFAASLNPLQLWRLRGGRFVDVTASYRGRIAADAQRLWAFVRGQAKQRGEARGAFAAWAADACRLSGWGRVARAAAPLVASGVFSPPRTDSFGPTGKRFPPVLRRDLTRFGYCRRG